MKIDRRRLLSSSGAMLMLAAGGRVAAAPEAGAYAWRNMPFGGGGFVGGIVLHARQPGLAYVRCDRGGVYRRDGHGQPWVPLLDHLGGADADLTSVLTLALDPQDPNRLFLACGDTTGNWSRKAAVLVSSDRGNSWTVHEQPFHLGGSEGGRGSGERLQVDPQDGRVLVLGTTRAGLLKSTDGGASFSATGLQARHVSLVLFDPAGGGKVFYAGSVDSPGLYVTRDGGATFKREEGAPAEVPQRAAFGPDGTVVVSFAVAGDWPPNPGGLRGGSVWKRSPAGAWKDITPSRRQGPYAFGALDVDRQGRIVTSMLLEGWDGPGDELYLSGDGGASWTALSKRSTFDTRSHSWLAARMAGAEALGHQIADARFDPADPERLLCGSEFGLWSTTNLGAAQRDGGRVQWRFDVAQLEQAPVLTLLSPSGGVVLFAGMGRGLGGGAWEDVGKAPDAGLFRPCRETTPSVDAAWLAPSIVARTIEGGSGGAVSVDGGAKWVPFGAQSHAKDARGGHVAVSAKGGSIVWAPPQKPAMVSHDRGRTWRVCKGWPEGPGEFVPVAEKNAEGVFYVFDYARGQVLVTVDAGLSFAPSLKGLPELNPSWQRGFVVSAPGKLRDLWIGLPDALLNVGGVDERARTIKNVPGVAQLALGKAAPGGAAYHSVYLAGRVLNSSGVEQAGLFRSDDAGASFRAIDERQRFGAVVALAADPLEHGTVYVGTRGRGVLVGKPQAA